nr:MAG TPA: hypothetical protein [Caudoviricetes sp.]
MIVVDTGIIISILSQYYFNVFYRPYLNINVKN